VCESSASTPQFKRFSSVSFLRCSSPLPALPPVTYSARVPGFPFPQRSFNFSVATCSLPSSICGGFDPVFVAYAILFLLTFLATLEIYVLQAFYQTLFLPRPPHRLFGPSKRLKVSELALARFWQSTSSLIFFFRPPKFLFLPFPSRRTMHNGTIAKLFPQPSADPRIFPPSLCCPSLILFLIVVWSPRLSHHIRFSGPFPPYAC